MIGLTFFSIFSSDLCIIMSDIDIASFTDNNTPYMSDERTKVL